MPKIRCFLFFFFTWKSRGHSSFRKSFFWGLRGFGQNEGHDRPARRLIRGTICTIFLKKCVTIGFRNVVLMSISARNRSLSERRITPKRHKNCADRSDIPRSEKKGAGINTTFRKPIATHFFKKNVQIVPLINLRAGRAPNFVQSLVPPPPPPSQSQCNTCVPACFLPTYSPVHIDMHWFSYSGAVISETHRSKLTRESLPTHPLTVFIPTPLFDQSIDQISTQVINHPIK